MLEGTNHALEFLCLRPKRRRAIGEFGWKRPMMCVEKISKALCCRASRDCECACGPGEVVPVPSMYVTCPRLARYVVTFAFVYACMYFL